MNYTRDRNSTYDVDDQRLTKYWMKTAVVYINNYTWYPMPNTEY